MIMNVWIVTGTPSDEPYPCGCASPPCRERGERTCPCYGAAPTPAAPDWCCAVQRQRAGLKPWAQRW